MPMEFLQDTVFLSRLQFAGTAMFHILWPITTIGISLMLVVFEILWLRTGDIDYYRHARFWAKLFLLNFSYVSNMHIISSVLVLSFLPVAVLSNFLIVLCLCFNALRLSSLRSIKF